MGKPGRPSSFVSREQRIGAVADYLLGKKFKYIIHKWNICPTTLMKFIRATGHFKTRTGEQRCSKSVTKLSQE